MRTTIDMTDAQRSELLRIAASRGEKGFSGIVQEALELYLSTRQQDSQKVAAALSARGSLSDDDARELAASCAEIRAVWR